MGTETVRFILWERGIGSGQALSGWSGGAWREGGMWEERRLDRGWFRGTGAGGNEVTGGWGAGRGGGSCCWKNRWIILHTG